MCAPDDTPRAAPPASPPRDGAERPREPEGTPLGYYYDDGTGYEVYNPSEEEETDEETDAD